MTVDVPNDDDDRMFGKPHAVPASFSRPEPGSSGDDRIRVLPVRQGGDIPASRPPSTGITSSTQGGIEHGSVLDAIAETRNRVLKGFEEQARNGTLPVGPDGGVLSAADRLAIEEAWARAGIPTLATPRGLIELTKGLLEAEEWRRILDDKTRLQIVNLQLELAIIEAGREDAIKLKKLVGGQTIELQTLTGSNAALLEQMKLEECRLKQELSRLNADVVRRQEETKRELAMLEDELQRTREANRLALSREQTDWEKEEARTRAQITARRTELDTELSRLNIKLDEIRNRRAGHRVWLEDHKWYIYGAVLAFILVVALVFGIALLLK